MLHTKFHDNRPTDFGEENFQKVLPYIGVAPSRSCDPVYLYKFSFLCSHKYSNENCFQMTKQFLRKAIFNFLI